MNNKFLIPLLLIFRAAIIQFLRFSSQVIRPPRQYFLRGRHTKNPEQPTKALKVHQHKIKAPRGHPVFWAREKTKTTIQ
jgi:hypothetical protein